MEKKLIDVSQHNGRINWSKVKNSGIDYAILRIGWIGKSKQQIDTRFEEYYNGARSVGIKVGVYVYNYAKSSQKMVDGANWVINLLKNKPIQLPIYIDMEDETLTILGKDILTQLCVDFNSTIEKNGYWAGVYANKYWFDNCLHKDILGAKYTCWVAQYSNTCSLVINNKDIWQYSEKGEVDGIDDNNVDMNILYRDLVAEISGNSNNDNKEDDEGGFEVAKVYKNGSKPEDVYADTNLTKKVGVINAWEECEYLSIDDDRPLVRYKIDGSNTYKCGYVKWKGGCQ